MFPPLFLRGRVQEKVFRVSSENGKSLSRLRAWRLMSRLDISGQDSKNRGIRTSLSDFSEDVNVKYFSDHIHIHFFFDPETIHISFN